MHRHPRRRARGFLPRRPPSRNFGSSQARMGSLSYTHAVLIFRDLCADPSHCPVMARRSAAGIASRFRRAQVVLPRPLLRRNFGSTWVRTAHQTRSIPCASVVLPSDFFFASGPRQTFLSRACGARLVATRRFWFLALVSRPRAMVHCPRAIPRARVQGAIFGLLPFGVLRPRIL